MNKFKKQERLSGDLAFVKIIQNGKSYFKFPYRFVYRIINGNQEYPVKVGFSVPKRNIRRAVKRNYIKRRLKEVYRLNKQRLYKHLQDYNVSIELIIIYIDKKVINYREIEQTLPEYLNELFNKIYKENCN